MRSFGRNVPGSKLVARDSQLFGSNLPILAAEIEEWLALPHLDLFHLRNKDGVIAGRLCRVQTALQISQRAFEHGSAVCGAFKASADCFGVLMRLG